MTRRYKFADVETAGFKGPDENGSGVVEVAWIEVDEQLNELSCFRSLVNPGRPIEPSASEVHGITDDMVAFSPTLEVVYANAWNGDPTVVIAHNKNFDLKFLAGQIAVLSGSLCTLNAARQYIPEAPNHKLGTLANFLGIEVTNAHSALDDCRTGLALLKHIMARTGRTLPELVKLDEKPKILTEMPFGEHKGKPFNSLPASYLEWMLRVDMPADIQMSARHALDLK